jgi:GGDEF domain-containing protein
MMLNRNFIQDRDSFLHLLELELKRSLRYQSFTSVLLVEIPANRKLDAAKATFFERVVNSLSSQIRETDIIGTTNEHMIAIILLNCDKRSTSEVADRVSSWTSQYFGADNSRNDGTPSSRVGVGTACFPTHATDSEHLLSTAAEMLETSKLQPEVRSRFQP